VSQSTLRSCVLSSLRIVLDVFVEVVSRFVEFKKVIIDARFVSFEGKVD